MTGAPLPARPRPSGRPPIRRAGAGTRHRHPAGAPPGPGTDHRGWLRLRAAAVGVRCVCWRSPIGWGGLCWPIRCREAGSRGRSPQPTPSSAPSPRCRNASSCSARPGSPGRSAPTSPMPPVPVRGSSSSIRGGSGLIRPEWPRSSTSAGPKTGSRPLARRRSRAIRSGSPPGDRARPRRRRPSPGSWGRT